MNALLEMIVKAIVENSERTRRANRRTFEDYPKLHRRETSKARQADNPSPCDSALRDTQLRNRSVRVSLAYVRIDN